MATASPIQITDFRELERWDVKYFTGRIVSKYPLVPLSKIVYEHNEKIRPSEYPDQFFKILGVNNTTGIFHAYDTLGKKIKQPYKKVSAGDFAYNPYRINVGSIGLVPDEHGDGYISPAYVVFGVDRTKILPEILRFILKSDFFNKSLRAATAGSVRMNLTYPLLQTLKVPIPTIDVQRKIFAYWRKTQNEINCSIEITNKVKDQETKRFINDLGLKLPKTCTHSKFFSVKWNDFDRWSVSYNQIARSMINLERGKYLVVNLGSILDLIQYGTSEKANVKSKGLPILRINNIKDGLIDFNELKHIQLKEHSVENLLLKCGDILIIRTSGSRSLVGTCAVFNEAAKYTFASYLIRMRISVDKAYSHYVAYYINSPIGRQQVDSLSRQIMQNNINSQELRSLKIPLPPLSIQQKMMKRVEEGLEEVHHGQMVSEQKYSDAKREIGKMILGLRPVEGT